MEVTRTHAVLLTALVVASVVVALPAVGSAATPGDPPEPDQKQRPPSDGANFTVVPKTQHDRKVGVTDATYLMLSKGAGPYDGSDGLETIDFYKITSQQADFSACNPNNAQAFGIDRGNDAPGTKTDEALLKHMKNNRVGTHVILVEIYDEGDLAGDPTYLKAEDETVAQLGNCIENAGPKGWYQFKGYVNGTNYQGEFQEVLLYSEYFYVCDCASEEEAEQKLGPKPYSDDGGSSTPTATPSDGGSSTPTATPTDGDSSTPTATATVTATATPTATPADGDQSAPTATATATPTATPADGGQSTPTATAASGDGGDGGNGATTATTTATAGNAGGSNDGGGAARDRGGPEERVTPTAGDGPGFGALAALAGVLAGALLALRRD